MNPADQDQSQEYPQQYQPYQQYAQYSPYPPYSLYLPFTPYPQVQPLGQTPLGYMVDKATASQFAPKKRRRISFWGMFLLVAFLCLMIEIIGDLNGFPSRVTAGFSLLFIGVSISWMQTSALTEGSSPNLWQNLKHHRITVSVGVRYIMTLVGIVLAFIGVFTAFSAFLRMQNLLVGMGAALVLMAVLGIIIAPWWISLLSDLGKEKAKAAQEELRADITARLHDSVLQTLALIHLHADDPQEVSALARSQERELRQWLYGDGMTAGFAPNPSAGSTPGPNFGSGSGPVTPGAPGVPVAPAQGFGPNSGSGANPAYPYPYPASAHAATIAEELKRGMAQVEDSSRVPIDLVVVGDTRFHPSFKPLLAAAHEAAVNAVRHGKSPVSVYCEVDPVRTHTIQIFVRDHGDGFDVSAEHPGHLGVSESIINRMQRAHGQAVINSRPGWGTEVKLALPYSQENNLENGPANSNMQAGGYGRV